MRGKKIIVAIIAIVLCVCMMPSVVHALAYTKSGELMRGWVSVDGKWYYYQDGKSVTGWKKIGGEWYYFNTNGVMRTGWLKEKGKWYYLDRSGKMLTGYHVIEDWNQYYFGSDGAMRTGWVKRSDGEWTYQLPSGESAWGWHKIGGVWYYFFEECDFIMAHDETIHYVDGRTFTFASSGAWIK